MSRQRLLCLGPAALLASGLVLLSTRHGVTTTADSAVYVGVARSVDAGQGLEVPIHFYPLGSVSIGTPPPGRFAPRPTPLVHYAPLAPLLLSIGGHPFGAARVEDALFFALTVLVVGLFALAVTDELWLSVAVQLVVAGSLAVAISDVGTVAAALFFTVVALATVIAYRRRLRPAWLIVASIAIGLATLERFAAGGLIVWGVIALRHRRRAAVALLVMSSLPVGAWFAYEHISGTGTGHPLGFHLVKTTIRAGVYAIAAWILPSGGPVAIAALGAVAVVVIVVVLLWRSSGEEPRLLVLFAVVQVVILEVAITFYDAGIRNPIELIPVFVALVMAAACAINRTTAMKVLVAAVLVACFTRTGLEIASDVPAGYAAPGWVHSPIMAAVRALPTNTIVYSNAPDAIYLLDDRPTSSIPETVDFSTLRRNPNFDAELTEIRHTLSTRGGLVVYVRGLQRGAFLPSEESLVRLLPLRLVRDTSDGAIYSLARPAH